MKACSQLGSIAHGPRDMANSRLPAESGVSLEAGRVRIRIHSGQVTWHGALVSLVPVSLALKLLVSSVTVV